MPKRIEQLGLPLEQPSPKPFKVSQSKVKTYRRCHRAYHNKYVEKLKRKRVKRPLMFGRIVHEMLDAFAGGDDPFDVLEKIDLDNARLFAVEKEQYGEIIADIRTIMTDYFDHWDERDLVYVRINKKSSEHEFDIELMPGVMWNGKIDGIAKTPNKLRWLVEHKTFTRMPGEDERWRNLQSVTYIRAIDILGWKPVDGTCWDYIRSKAPPRPGLLADGSMSRKNIDTLPTAVLETIEAHGFKAKDYKEFLVTIQKNRDTWFKRIHTPVSKDVVDKVFGDFEATVREMVEKHGKVKDMNIERHCGWCDFEPLCRAELQGHDVDYIKQKEYYIDDKDRQEIGDEPGTDE